MMQPHTPRKKTRLETYDYSNAGAYFVTICAQMRDFGWFGQVTPSGIQLNQAGKMVHEVWHGLAGQFGVSLDAFVVMPDHVHGIVVLHEDAVYSCGQEVPKLQQGDTKIIHHNSVGAGLVPARVTKNDLGINPPMLNDSTSHRATTRVAPTHGQTANPILGDVIGAFKSITTNQYMRGVREHHWMPFEKRFWQRGFYDRIVRNNAELERNRDYIVGNPARWLER
jgi:putative transposase